MARGSALMRAIAGERWAIQPENLTAILEVVSAWTAGGTHTEAELAAMREAAAARSRGSVRGAVAVLPLVGTITQRAGMIADYSGGTSTDAFATAFNAAVADPAVGGIVLDVDSPGGGVYGVQELSDTIYAARGTKPIVAVANSLMASAAYWIASAADSISITPGGEVGSIGVLGVHVDTSVANEAAGVRYSVLAMPAAKAEGNPYEPLADETRTAWMADIETYYNAFVGAVARNRGTTRRGVHSKYGGGRTLLSAAAVSAGMVDRVETLDAVIGRMAGKK